jgi:hypothetical protein
MEDDIPLSLGTPWFSRVKKLMRDRDDFDDAFAHVMAIHLDAGYAGR